MASEGQSDESVARRYAVLRPYLDERQRRLLLGAEAAELGRGGIKAVALATGVHPDTVAKGVRELEGGVEPAGRVRAPGGGRKPATENDPGLGPALRTLVDPQTRGEPTSPLVWTTKSTRNLADALAGGGHRVSDRTVARMLRAQGFSLQANAKVTEGRQHVDRDAQLGYPNAAVVEHLAIGAPVVSVDTKKKNWWASSTTAAASTNPRVHRCASTCTTSRTRSWARLSRTASTTSPRTPAGCRSAPIMTPQRSPWRRCAAGGTPWAGTATPTPTGC